MLDFATTFVIPFLIILSILVLIHEFGHFITAKKFGIKVEEFGFGFPPRLFGKKIGETLYSFNLLPIGGFVKLYGEDEAGGGSLQRTNNQEPTADLKRAFFARPPWQKATIVLAGVVMNFILAVAIISYLFTVPGVGVPKEHPDVVATLPDTPASRIHLQKGDKIISFNNNPAKTVSDLRKVLAKNRNREGKLIIERSGHDLSFQVIPQKIVENGLEFYAIGVELSDVAVKKFPWYQAPFFGTLEALKFSWMILSGLGGIILNLISRGQAPTDVAGPVGVAQIVGQAAKIGLTAELWVAALLSLNLAVVNVLPIPALDGGRLFFILIELVSGKRVSSKYETMAHAVGLAVLLTLILLVTLFDITRLLSGQSLIPKM